VTASEAPTVVGAGARCSVLASAAGEPLAGSAPRARAWLVLEQPGPYGFRALTTSHLPEPVREVLGRLPKDSGTTVLLARRVGHHADDHTTTERRRFWFAHVSPGGVRMRAGVLDDAELLRPDLADVLAAAARGELPPWGTRTSEPLLLVCTNARRDVCCALAGRPVAESLAADAAYSERVLEVSHLGGHRFAPTALLLPSGHAFGRFDAVSARALLDGADVGEIGSLAHHRGRTALPQPAQAAETAVRVAAGILGLDDLDALRVVDGRAVPVGLRWSGEDGVAVVQVRHRDGRAWRVEVVRTTLPEPKPESCGKAAVDAHVWVAGEPEPLAAWA
jgi:hypothetical protein